MTDQDLAALFLAARAGGKLVTAAPADEAQAYRVQSLVMAALGPIGGWKVGAPGPDGPITCAPMPAGFVVAAPHRFDPAVFTQREVESEICFRLGADLPARAAPYGRAEVLDAIAGCHGGIEILQSRLSDPARASAVALLADFLQTGAYAVGAAVAGWRAVDFASLRVRQTISGGAAREAVGNPAGEMIRLVVWLANRGVGLRAGQIVTCGSWTGKTQAPPGSTVHTTFDGAQPVEISF